MTEYEQYAYDPSPDNMEKLLKSLRPVIDAEVNRQGGGDVMKARAKVLAAKAIKAYDPAFGANIKTWVSHGLQPLSRVKGKMQPIYVPEVRKRRAAELQRIESEFKDEKGHIPSDSELADRIGLSVRKVNELRKTSLGHVTESAFTAGASDGGGDLPAFSVPSRMREAADITYKTFDDRDKQIYDGLIRDGLSGKDVAAKLGITPAAVSQRGKHMAERIEHANTLLGGW